MFRALIEEAAALASLALFLGMIAILPFLLGLIIQTQVTTFLNSTSLLIVVGVAVDTMKQLEAQLVMREYQGILR